MPAHTLVNVVYSLLVEKSSIEEVDELLSPSFEQDDEDDQLARIYAIGGEVL